MPKEASRYGFVLRNQTNLNRPRIGESEVNPESRVAGHLERMPKEASWYGFVLRNHTNLNRPRIGESEAKPESRVARPRRKGARLLLYLISQSPARKKKTHYLGQGFFCLVSATVREIGGES